MKKCPLRQIAFRTEDGLAHYPEEAFQCSNDCAWFIEPFMKGIMEGMCVFCTSAIASVLQAVFTSNADPATLWESIKNRNVPDKEEKK